MSETIKPTSEPAPQLPEAGGIPISPELAEAIQQASAAITRSNRESHIASIKEQKAVEAVKATRGEVKTAKNKHRNSKRHRKTAKRNSKHTKAQAKKVFKKSNKVINKGISKGFKPPKKK